MDRVVISDTSCLIALINIEQLELLKELFQEIIITTEVYQEFGGLLPDWIIVTEVKDKHNQAELEKRLDKGEASSIALALENSNTLLIIDEVKGRKIAKTFKIEIIGTIGIIVLGGKKGLIPDVLSTILHLVNRGFRLSDDLLNQIIEKYGRR